MNEESSPPPPETPPVPSPSWTPSEPPPPQAYAAPAPPASRTQRSLLIGLGAVGVVILLVIAYVAIGLVDAEAKLAKAQSTYNTVIHHQNSVIETDKGLVSKLPSSDTTTGTSTASIQQEKATIDQIISQAKSSQPQIASDRDAMTNADAQLKSEQWLTVVSRSRLDSQSKKDGYLLAALADSKKIADDYVAVGPFLDAFLDVTADVEDLGNKVNAKDLSGLAVTNEKLKADLAKAIQADKAPGLPPEVDTFLHLIQAFSTDMTNVLNAAGRGDNGAFDAANASLQSDSTKLENFDYPTMSGKIQNFYQSLIDVYNADIDKANKA